MRSTRATDRMYSETEGTWFAAGFPLSILATGIRSILIPDFETHVCAKPILSPMHRTMLQNLRLTDRLSSG
jgi:hypothetical protein